MFFLRTEQKEKPIPSLRWSFFLFIVTGLSPTNEIDGLSYYSIAHNTNLQN